MSFASGFFLTVAVIAAPLLRELTPTNWPIQRIISNLEARLADDANDAEVHYNLGRAHGFAFALERPSLLSTRSGFPKNLDDQPARIPFTDDPAWMKPSDVLVHLQSGVEHLRRAREIGDYRPATNARFALTLAWLLETGAHLSDRVDTISALGVRPATLSADETETVLVAIERLGDPTATDGRPRQYLTQPTILERALPLLYTQTASSNSRRQRAVCALIEQYWLERAITAYWDAIQLSLDPSTGKLLSKYRSRDTRHSTPYEAVDGYRRLVEARGVREPDRPRLAEAARVAEQLDALPVGGFVTPILLSLEGYRGLNDLVRLDHAVPFDLDGDGNTESWPWIAPNAGWLVWDPMREAHITSGRQLVGSASGWLFFEDGYRVLDALDDDRDERLSGAELCGLAVWFDRNGDGISTRSEVTPVEQLGIAALSTRATESIGASLANECGLELADGRVLPTYDWVLASATE